MPTPELVGAHVAAHERLGDRVVVIGPMLNPPDHRMSPWVRWEQTMLQKQYGALERGVYSATARQFYTGNASVRREHVLDVGGFDTSLRRVEDVELAFRLRQHGLEFAYEPQAIGLHYAERSFNAWIEIAAAYGRNDVVFARDRGHAEVYDWITSNYHARHRLIRRRDARMRRTCTHDEGHGSRPAGRGRRRQRVTPRGRQPNGTQWHLQRCLLPGRGGRARWPARALATPRSAACLLIGVTDQP